MARLFFDSRKGIAIAPDRWIYRPMSSDEHATSVNYLEEGDVRTMVRILAEISSEGQDLNGARVRLVDQLAEVISADRWVWSLLGEVNTAQPPASTVFLHGGFSEKQLTNYIKVQEHPDLRWMTAPFLEALEGSERQVTRLQSQLVTEEQITKADIFPHLIVADLGPILLSGCQTRAGQLSIISLFRSPEKPLFNARDSRLAHILLSEVPWLHDTAWPHHPRSDLSRLTKRQRTVLALLLQGYQRKRVAESMELSIHTVSEYVKLIYETFGVHSHAELIHRFHHGDGGDLTSPSDQP